MTRRQLSDVLWCVLGGLLLGAGGTVAIAYGFDTVQVILLLGPP